MKKIEELLSDLTYDVNSYSCSGWKPELIMKKLDVKNMRIFFDLNRNYDCRATYSEQEAEEILRKKRSDNAFKELYVTSIDNKKDGICYLMLSADEMQAFVKDIIKLCFYKKPLTCIVPTISIKETEEKTNIGSGVYRLYYTLDDLEIPVIRLRKKMLDADIEYLRKRFFGYAEEFLSDSFKKHLSDEIMKMNGIKKGDFNYLCECFDYEDVDKDTVILSLKKELNTEHLLRFRGFNCGYSTFKLYMGEGEKSLTMVKGDNYFTIVWGNSTTCCSKYYWDMRDELLKCVQMKLLKF